MHCRTVAHAILLQRPADVAQNTPITNEMLWIDSEADGRLDELEEARHVVVRSRIERKALLVSSDEIHLNTAGWPPPTVTAAPRDFDQFRSGERRIAPP